MTENVKSQSKKSLLGSLGVGSQIMLRLIHHLGRKFDAPRWAFQIRDSTDEARKENKRGTKKWTVCYVLL